MNTNDSAQRTGFAAINSADELELYAYGQRQIAVFREALNKLSDLSIDELEGIARFIQNRIERKQKLEADIAGMSSEEITDALERVLAELKTRRAAKAAEDKEKQAQREAVDPRKLAASVIALAEDLRSVH